MTRVSIADRLTVAVHVKLTPQQRAKFHALGASHWLRKAIDADYARRVAVLVPTSAAMVPR